MSRYHRLLGVSENASKAEIKKAYRTLAKKLHPDRNSAPDADDKFAAVQEAYDFLMEGPTSTSNTYNQSEKKSSYSSAEERIRVARERLKMQEQREKESNEKFFQRLINGPRGKFVHIGSIICLIASITFMLDSILPHHVIPDQIEAVSNSIGKGRVRPGIQVIYTKGGEAMELDLVSYSWGDKQLKIRIEKTWFFHIPIAVTQEVQANAVSYPIFRELWQKPPLPILFFAIPACLLFYQKRTATFTGLYMSSFYIFIPLTLLFLVDHFRWLHILTLGFF